MKIQKIELRIVEIPYIHPFETSFGREYKNQEVIVRLKSEDKEGFGECVGLDKPYYSYETVKTEWHILEDFIIPEIRNEEFETAQDLLQTRAVGFAWTPFSLSVLPAGIAVPAFLFLRDYGLSALPLTDWRVEQPARKTP